MAYSKEELAHYGVKGMKWGVRSGGLGERFRGSIADNAQRRAAVRTRQNNNTAKGLDEKLWRTAHIVAGGGKNRMVQRNKKQIDRMKQREARVKAGELKARDIMRGLIWAGPANLTISRRDNKGT